MPPRLHPDRPLTNPEKQARKNERQRAYLASLERAVCAIDDGETLPMWRHVFSETIARARSSLEKRND